MTKPAAEVSTPAVEFEMVAVDIVVKCVAISDGADSLKASNCVGIRTFGITPLEAKKRSLR